MNFFMKLSCIRFFSVFFSLLLCLTSFAQSIVRADPPNWWSGMQQNKIEILFQAKYIAKCRAFINSEHCKILGTTPLPNSDYLLVEIEISPDCPPGKLEFTFASSRNDYEYSFPIESRSTKTTKGLGANDLVYLVFPDRFSNGDPSNDNNPSLLEPKADRGGLKSRHGGDIQGITNHIGHFQELGVTALWLNPVLENNQPYESYHGYAATDLYKVDPRLGTNASYKQLVAECHKKGIKVIWDVVYNHWGNEHHLFKNLPDSNWVHWFPKFTRTSYRAETLMDPYASKADRDIMTNAWFDKHMPDLNQQDPHLARYLIQNSLWWVEYAGIDAFRIDTYAYPDQIFMKQLDEAMRLEYPDFFLFGETWVQGSPVQAWFTEEAEVKKNFNSSLHSVTDFQLYYAITKGLKENFGWEEGFRRIELTLAHDILYKEPNNLVTFLDNHDLSRFYSMMGEDMASFKMGIALLYTLRGIPSIYYGTEILMKNYSDPDAKVREDFPGGWPGDTSNKFTSSGRTRQEQEAFDFCSILGTWRKANPWLGKSKLMQFVPEENTYVYFRYDDMHTVMCVYNGNDKAHTLKLDRFSERIGNVKVGRDVISRRELELSKELVVDPRQVLVIELPQ